MCLSVFKSLLILSHVEGLRDGGQAFQGLESERQMEMQESRSGCTCRQLQYSRYDVIFIFYKH